MREWLRILREKGNFTQQNVASELNVTRQYYQAIECGEKQKDLNLSLVMKLAEFFNVTVDYIIEQERSDLYAERAGGDA